MSQRARKIEKQRVPGLPGAAVQGLLHQTPVPSQELAGVGQCQPALPAAAHVDDFKESAWTPTPMPATAGATTTKQNIHPKFSRHRSELCISVEFVVCVRINIYIYIYYAVYYSLRILMRLAILGASRVGLH